MRELVIKVPSPFSGIDDVGFTARQPAQDLNVALLDVPIIVEGASRPMRILVSHLSTFADKERIVSTPGDDDAYVWTPPIQITDEICVLSFRDMSKQQTSVDVLSQERQYLWNLVRPLAVTFLRDCIRLGNLKLRDHIEVVMSDDILGTVDITLRLSDIAPQNGVHVLYAA